MLELNDITLDKKQFINEFLQEKSKIRNFRFLISICGERAMI